jgi:hypothetical protein
MTAVISSSLKTAQHLKDRGSALRLAGPFGILFSRTMIQR